MSHEKIGVDAGGTLIKIAYEYNESLQFQTFYSEHIKEAVDWIHLSFDSPNVCVTGGKSKLFESLIGVPVKSVVEFSATCNGAIHLAQKQKVTLDHHYILSNVGTGTSIHYIKDGDQERIGGTGVGGGTVMGLSYLLTGLKDFEEIVKLSQQGRRQSIDLQVKDIFEGMEPPIDGSLTASNFGKLGSLMDKEFMNHDKIASVIGMVAETVVTISCQAALRFDTSSVVYIGSTFRSNPLMEAVIDKYTRLQGLKPYFLNKGEFSGAVGARLTL